MSTTSASFLATISMLSWGAPGCPAEVCMRCEVELLPAAGPTIMRSYERRYYPNTQVWQTTRSVQNNSSSRKLPLQSAWASVCMEASNHVRKCDHRLFRQTLKAVQVRTLLLVL